MRHPLNLRRVITGLIAVSAVVAGNSQSIGSAGNEWHLGMEVMPSYVPGTNDFLKGQNKEEQSIDKSLSGSLRMSFSFAPDSRKGMLYPGLYQGVGLGSTSFFAYRLLGSPVSLFVFQGAPVVRLSSRAWFGYEWKFGVAFGWKYGEYEENVNGVVSSSATAHMALAAKFHYEISDRWELVAGPEATHYSNGHTSWPNGGVNSIGVSVGTVYRLNKPAPRQKSSEELIQEADKGRWMIDVMAFGAWRTRVVNVGDPPSPVLCPGKFPVAGINVAMMRKLNRFVAVGPSVDFQWDQSAGLAPYWAEDYGIVDVKFYRPPFGKQISLGISAHAELTMPIFSVNIGLGNDFVSPKGEKSFYQSLTLKTFITSNIYLNVGYRLGAFKDPQNLMLGVGFRL